MRGFWSWLITVLVVGSLMVWGFTYVKDQLQGPNVISKHTQALQDV